MRKIIELVRYQLQIYFKGSRFIMPLVLTVIVLYMMYSVASADIVGCFSMTCYLVFVVMAWVGFSVSASENVVMEQIQLLRVQSDLFYYTSKVLFLIVLGVLLDCVCVAVPVFGHILSHMKLFGRQLTGYDVLNAFILFGGCSFAGGTLGGMLHPGVMRDRKSAVLLTVLAVVLSIVRTAVWQEIPFVKLIIWIIPPLDNVSVIYGREEYFRLSQTNKIFLPLLLYGIIYSMIKSAICYRRKFIQT